jgi:hypothetical protein
MFRHRAESPSTDGSTVLPFKRAKPSAPLVDERLGEGNGSLTSLGHDGEARQRGRCSGMFNLVHVSQGAAAPDTALACA